MSQAPPAWQGYVFKLAGAIAQGESTAKEKAGVLHQLPELLSTGASPLEIARRTQTTRTKVSDLLSDPHIGGLAVLQPARESPVDHQVLSQ